MATHQLEVLSGKFQAVIRSLRDLRATFKSLHETDSDQVIEILTNEAENLRDSSNGENGVVRSLVARYGPGFNAWFYVRCESADRTACRKGFEDKAHLMP